MFENLKSKSIVLASKSPRRKVLLSSLGIKFKVKKISIKEDFPNDLNKLKIAEYLAIKKSSKLIPNDNELIITADTVVIHNNIILNKPQNSEEAKKILNTLSNTKHKVITGVCIKQKNKKISFSEETKVYFKKLTKSEIDFYLNNYNPYDKAGAYGVQDWIGKIGIKSIEGCYYNIMGLPLRILYNNLIKL